MVYDYLDPFVEKAKGEFCGIVEPKHIFNTKTEFKDAIKANLKEQRKYLTYKNSFESTTCDYIKNMIIKNFNLQSAQFISELNGYNLTTVKNKIEAIANEMIDFCDNLGIRVLNHNNIRLKLEQAELENDYIIFQAEQKHKKKEEARRIREQNKADREWQERFSQLKSQELVYAELGDNEKCKEIKEKIDEATHMLKFQRAGWVYIISNEDMAKGSLKIGLTRRPSPLVRINELSNASHAFKFKIHALIYTEDCFALEGALHRRFADKRINKDNWHKEFFWLELDELQRVLKNEFNIDCAMHDDIYEDDELLEKYYTFDFNEEE
jgi:hypothetical protein